MFNDYAKVVKIKSKTYSQSISFIDTMIVFDDTVN